MILERFFMENPKIALCFSGGTDSSFLLYAAKKYGADVKPYFVKTAFQPAFELRDARKFAESAGVLLNVIELDILRNSNIVENCPKRCYYCKKEILSVIKSAAEKDGYNTIIDGCNADDDEGDRPGMKAISELSVLSPLRICGLTKNKIREFSKEAKLFTWDKPAYACLATRFPVGMEITAEGLRKVENAEDLLFSLGFSDFRVRLQGKSARIQMPESQMKRLLDKRDEILSGLNKFEAVLLDLKPR